MEKKHLVISTLAAALLSASAASLAQDRYHGDRARDRDRHEQRDRDHDRHGDGRGWNDERSYHGRDNRRWNGAGPEHEFRRGDRLPPRYRHNQYVVDNWREHRLRPPPRGYHWVQTGSDYVLAAIATGLIADLIVHH